MTESRHESSSDAEPGLPRVPLPTLASSCSRFLEWCAPLLTPDELAQTEEAVSAFLAPDSPAHALQARLEEYDATEGVQDWLGEFWADRYLGRRGRIALDANFFFLLHHTGEGQVTRAARLVAAATAHKLALDEPQLPPTVLRGRPQSTVQTGQVYSSTRIPGATRDESRRPRTRSWPGPSTARHVVVLHHGRMFALDVIGPDGRPHAIGELRRALDSILSAAAVPADEDARVGHLTTAPRAEWAAGRQALIALDDANAATLDAIERALFCVSLDGSVADELDACDQLLHGGGGNRWFDKAVTLVVFADGTAGLSFEHAHLDGTTAVDLIDALCAGEAAEPGALSEAGGGRPPWISELAFVLDDRLRHEIRTAGAAFAAHAADTTTATVVLDSVGSDVVKSHGMSPDAFAQLAFQLALTRATGRTGSTYESISTRHFHHGRTEAMRVVTPAVLRLLAAMSDPAADRETRLAALRAAADSHVERARQCRAGDAPEQHLWELQMLGRRTGAVSGSEPALGLYESPGWLTMRQDRLSTSSVVSDHVRHFGFGPTGEQCLGVGYALLPASFRAHLSARRSAAEELRRFRDVLPAAFDDLLELLGVSR